MTDNSVPEKCNVKAHLILQGKVILVWLGASAFLAALVGPIRLIDNPKIILIGLMAIPIAAGGILVIGIIAYSLYATLLFPTVDLIRCLLRQKRQARQARP